MAAMASSFLHSNTSSRVWHERPPLVLPLCTPKSSLPAFPADQLERESTRFRLRRRLCLAQASPSKGSISEAEQNVDDQKLNLDQNKPLMNTQSSEDPQTQLIAGESTTDVLRHVNEEAKERMDQSETDTDERNSQQEREASGNGDTGELISGDTALKGTIVAGLLLVGVVGGFGAVSYLYREQINDFLLEFSDFIEGYGAAGYALFVAVYAGLEILAIPAIPLTMSAGLLFGTLTGTIIVSISGTIAATAAFLIARYLARDRILKLAEGNKKFMAIDKAIGENGFRVVALLRLSPLLPFSIGNYLYGLTSVRLVPYVLGSWLGMLPGTWAYVSAGAVGRAIIQSEAEGFLSGGPEQAWTLGLGLVVTVFAATYVTRLAKDAVKDIDE